MNTFAKHALCTHGFLALAALALATGGCGGDDNPYKPQPAWSGKKPNLPVPASLPTTPLRNGDGSYTVYGTIHQLRSLTHSKDVTANPITITGYIVDSNVPRAPECAIHKTGKADPEKCTPEIPSFWLADDKGATKGPKVRVVGWARNFAVVYDAMVAYKKVKAGEQPKEPVNDDILNVAVPFPLPSVGAKVKVTGSYNTSKTVASEMVSDPTGGVLGFQKMDTVEPAPSPAAFSKPLP